jgi:hypothetical protein
MRYSSFRASEPPNLYFAFRADRRRTYPIPSDFYPTYLRAEDARVAFKNFDKDNNARRDQDHNSKGLQGAQAPARSLRGVGEALYSRVLLLLVTAVILFFSELYL